MAPYPVEPYPANPDVVTRGFAASGRATVALAFNLRKYTKMEENRKHAVTDP